MWRFGDFTVTQILREMNFEDSRSAKAAILIRLDALNFDLYEFLHFLKAAITKLIKFRAPQKSKNGRLELLVSPKMVSRKMLT